MLSRRDVLRAAAGLAGTACSRKQSASWPRRTVHEGVEFHELFPDGADERAPLIVAIHGRGDRPENWVETWRTFPARVQIALPRAFDPLGDGFSWFGFREGMTDEQFGAEVSEAEARLFRGVARLAGDRRFLVTGFSQGGILSFAMASRRPDVVAHAFPVSGSCPGPLLPKDGAKAAPLLAFHGTDDEVLDIRWGREAVAAFAAQGNEAELREYPGVGHAVTPEMRADLWAAMKKALPR
jgi:phospholipase/carboxylesterase